MDPQQSMTEDYVHRMVITVAQWDWGQCCTLAHMHTHTQTHFSPLTVGGEGPSFGGDSPSSGGTFWCTTEATGGGRGERGSCSLRLGARLQYQQCVGHTYHTVTCTRVQWHCMEHTLLCCN